MVGAILNGVPDRKADPGSRDSRDPNDSEFFLFFPSDRKDFPKPPLGEYPSEVVSFTHIKGETTAFA